MHTMSASTPSPLSAVRLDRRRQLIVATVSVIYRDGLSRLTLAKVAATAGLSAATNGRLKKQRVGNAERK